MTIFRSEVHLGKLTRPSWNGWVGPVHRRNEIFQSSSKASFCTSLFQPYWLVEHLYVSSIFIHFIEFCDLLRLRTPPFMQLHNSGTLFSLGAEISPSPKTIILRDIKEKRKSSYGLLPFVSYELLTVKKNYSPKGVFFNYNR